MILLRSEIINLTSKFGVMPKVFLILIASTRLPANICASGIMLMNIMTIQFRSAATKNTFAVLTTADMILLGRVHTASGAPSGF